MICTPLAASRRTFDAPAPLAGEIAPFGLFYCTRLRALLRPCICVLRQAASERQRTAQGARGQSSDYPACQRCPQGEALRQALDPARSLAPRSDGPERGGRGYGLRRRRRQDFRAQALARERARLAGLIEIPPCLDEPPDEQGEDVV